MKLNPAKYLREVRQEVSKVTWPSKKETFTTAGIVLVVISIAAIILMLIDQFFSFLVRVVLGQVMVASSDTHKWYVVHCHSGYEKKVADAIMDEAAKVGLEELVSEVSVPTQAVVEVRRGVRVNSEKKFFPGYVLVKMVMNDDTWHLVRDVPKVSNFLGTKDKPIAISEREVSKLLQDITEGVDNPKPKFEYEVGEQIKVSDGPFASFSGIIEEVDSSRQKLKVSVSIFGRPTPLELDYSQVVKG